MKVLFVSPAANIYGSERSMLEALRTMERTHCEVACALGGNLETELRKLDIEPYHLPFTRSGIRRRPDQHLRLFARFQQVLNRSKPDAVAINLSGNTPVLSLACMVRRIPLVRFQRFEFSRPGRWIDRFCLRRAAAIICVSKHVQAQVGHWMGSNHSDRVQSLYDPQPLPEHAELVPSKQRRTSGLPDVPLLGFVGRLHRQKRVETLIRAIPLVRNRFSDVRALIIGSHDGGPDGRAYADELHEIAESLGCDKAVSFLGYRNDVMDLMAGCDLVVLPSETEACPRALVESWSLGVPTVATDIGPCREITEASGGGLLFPPGDSGELAARIIELLEAPDRAREMGHLGRDWVARECDPTTYGRRLEEVLLQVVRAEPQPQR